MLAYGWLGLNLSNITLYVMHRRKGVVCVHLCDFLEHHYLCDVGSQISGFLSTGVVGGLVARGQEGTFRGAGSLFYFD